MKKTWQAPQLIVLTRSKPEEAVLSGCKTDEGATGSPVVHDFMCDQVAACSDCYEIVSS